MTYINKKSQQQGLSLVNFIVWLIVLSSLAMLSMQVVPSIFEFFTIKKAAAEAAHEGQSIPEIQLAFDKKVNAGYITSIRSQDLTIAKEGESYAISFAYEKKLPLFGPVSLVIDFSGEAN